MTTTVTHAIPILALGLALGPRIIPPRLLIAGMLAAMAPDMDVIAFKFGIAYSDAFGHRGFSHSLLLAGVLGVLAAVACRWLHCGLLKAAVWISLAALSHSVFDALTNGGLGVAWFWPWDEQRYFLPWRPIKVAPFDPRSYLTPSGLQVIRSELYWVWLPCLVLVFTGWLGRWLFPRLQRTHLCFCLLAGVAVTLPGASPLYAAESQCYGTVSNGRIEGSVKLPLSGDNFSAYSALAASAGRTHLHSKVAAIVKASYAALAISRPSTHYVYGEMGWPAGGRFKPHRTHQNGLSVDFFVPVNNAKGESVPLPIGFSDRLGYDIEFDKKAKYGEYTIDFDALAEHLYQLDVAAKAAGSKLALVIFDTQYLAKLFASKHGAYLKSLPFMKSKPWVRHDEHYHVDFAIPCKPMRSNPEPQKR